ncbi:MAG: winged helix-turn-helix transcriptional regulator [Candidatus Hodarchaeota archaeon]
MLLTKSSKMKIFFFFVTILLFISTLHVLNNNFGYQPQEAGLMIEGSISSTRDLQTSVKESYLGYLFNIKISEAASWIQTFFVGKVSFERFQKWQNSKQDTPINQRLLKEVIIQNPGISLREIQRSTGLAMGVIQYHLRFLENTVVESFKQGRSKHFFEVNSQFSYEEKLWLSLIRNPTIKRILTSIGSEDNLSYQKDLVLKTGNSRALISYYIKLLKQQGIIEINTERHKLRITPKYDLISSQNYWKSRMNLKSS